MIELSNSVILDIALVSAIIGVGLGFFWGQHVERANWNVLLRMGVLPNPPKWAHKFIAPNTIDEKRSEWDPLIPADSTPMWDESQKKYVYVSPATSRNRNRWLF
jgi:hypothetical protein